MAELGAIRIVRIAGQGEQAKDFHLNRKQAIFIIAEADTPKAVEITIYVILTPMSVAPAQGSSRASCDQTEKKPHPIASVSRMIASLAEQE
jgi:hypothetical protein